MHRILPIVACLLSVAVAATAARSEEPFTPQQEEALGEFVRDYLIEHPEVIVEALRGYEEKQRIAQETRQRQAVSQHLEALVNDGSAPVIGNLDGDVTVVEFFDYRCPYCHKVAHDLRQAVESDGNVRLVMKEFPILGRESVYAARAALASSKQDRYEEFHFALMDAKGKLDEASVLRVAESLGLDVDRLKTDMHSKDVDLALRRNFELAEALEINGTPAFVIGETLVPGALSMEALRRLIAGARSG